MSATICDPRPTWTGLEFTLARLRRGRVPRTYKAAPPPHVIEMRHHALDLALVRARQELSRPAPAEGERAWRAV